MNITSTPARYAFKGKVNYSERRSFAHGTKRAAERRAPLRTRANLALTFEGGGGGAEECGNQTNFRDTTRPV